MIGTRVITVSIVQLDPETTASVHVTAAVDRQPDEIIQLREERAVVPWGPELREWAKNALLAAVDAL